MRVSDNFTNFALVEIRCQFHEIRELTLYELFKILSAMKREIILMLMLMVSVLGYAKVEIDGIFYNLNSETKEAEVTSEVNPES